VPAPPRLYLLGPLNLANDQLYIYWETITSRPTTFSSKTTALALSSRVHESSRLSFYPRTTCLSGSSNLLAWLGGALVLLAFLNNSSSADSCLSHQAVYSGYIFLLYISSFSAPFCHGLDVRYGYRCGFARYSSTQMVSILFKDSASHWEAIIPLADWIWGPCSSQ